jgi:hypothetical protein
MTVPLDRLYNYIERIAEEIHSDHVVIYRFYPHGSKNLADWSNLRDYDFKTFMLNAKVFCADQEPLDYDHYEQLTGPHDPDLLELVVSRNQSDFPGFFCNNLVYPFGRVMYRRPVLLHSEQRSSNVAQYHDDAYITAYYWSHAVIALDWFRFARHVTQNKRVEKTFLIYNRAWAGTREYRLRFAELLIHLNLQQHCRTSVNPIEPELGVHYDSHAFKNPQWRPQTVLENYFPISSARSHYSADFDMEDYAATDIEVVLETLFDDNRLHLTEKSLRPIACAQPFILAGTHGSLEYLRSYGFKTFSDVWDESYDLVEDPAERLTQIAELMKYISNWQPHQRESKMAQARQIAQYNRDHFFSDEFFGTVVNELRENLSTALEQSRQVSHKDVNTLIQLFEKLLALPELEALSSDPTQAEIAVFKQTLDHMKQQYLLNRTADTGTSDSV